MILTQAYFLLTVHMKSKKVIVHCCHFIIGVWSFTQNAQKPWMVTNWKNFLFYELVNENNREIKKGWQHKIMPTWTHIPYYSLLLFMSFCILISSAIIIKPKLSLSLSSPAVYISNEKQERNSGGSFDLLIIHEGNKNHLKYY